jgi:small subunit ribosomal protein S21
LLELNIGRIRLRITGISKIQPRYYVVAGGGHCSGRGVIRLAEIRIQEGESLENALRRFKRKVQQEDIIKEVKRHSYYLKPGEKARVKEALARKRARKKVRKEQA